MSKTVLLSDDLHRKIKETTITLSWVPTNLSMAKKIEIFTDLHTTYASPDTQTTFTD